MDAGAREPVLQQLLLSVAMVLLVVNAQTTGCDTVSPYTINRRFFASSIVTADGRNRTFNIFVPDAYSISVPAPLVFVLHGGFGWGAQAEAAYSWDQTAGPDGAVLVYPDGVNNTWNGGTCCGYAKSLNVDDVGFIRSLLDRLTTELCLDTTKIFSTGMSNGAIMSHRLGCELSDRIVAIGPVSGTLNFAPCTPTNPVGVYELHGLQDMNVPYYGGVGCGSSLVNFNSIPFSINSWLINNDCRGTSSVSVQIGPDANCTTYDSCTAPVTVTICALADGGHTWPGSGGAAAPGDPGCNQNTSTFPGTAHLWSYFSSYSRPTPPPSTPSPSSPSAPAPPAPAGPTPPASAGPTPSSSSSAAPTPAPIPSSSSSSSSSSISSTSLPQTTTSAPASPSSGAPVGAIVGGVIAGVVVVLAIVIVIIVVLVKKSAASSSAELQHPYSSYSK